MLHFHLDAEYLNAGPQACTCFIHGATHSPAPTGCSALDGDPLSSREKSEDRSPFLSISFHPYFPDVAGHMLTLLGVNT